MNVRPPNEHKLATSVWLPFQYFKIIMWCKENESPKITFLRFVDIESCGYVNDPDFNAIKEQTNLKIVLEDTQCGPFNDLQVLPVSVVSTEKGVGDKCTASSPFLTTVNKALKVKNILLNIMMINILLLLEIS